MTIGETKDNLTAVYMDMAELTDFKDYRQHKQQQTQLLARNKNWLELQRFAETIQFGSFNLTIKNGLPVRVDNPIQQVVFGVQI